MEVVLKQMLSAREARFMRQFALNGMHGLPIISFSMHIPGPVKDSPYFNTVFRSAAPCLTIACSRTP